MKKYLLILSAINPVIRERVKGVVAALCTVCVMFSAAAGCGKQEKEIHYEAIEIPYVGFSESLTSRIPGFWENIGKGEMFLINSNEELNKFIPSNVKHPDIDFSKHSLLLACGMTSNMIYEKSINSLLLFSTNKYKLHVKIELTLSYGVDYWNFALITDKISNNNNVSVNVTFN